MKMWPVNSEFGSENQNTFGGPEKGRLGFYWSLSKTVVLLEAARLSNNSRFSLVLVLRRRQIQTTHIRNKPRIIVPRLARRIISFFASSIGMRTVVFSVGSIVVLIVNSVVGLVVESLVGLVVVDSVVVRTSLVVNISVLVKRFIFCFWMK